MRGHKAHSERGSAILYVFIGTILFGALMYSFARMSSSSDPSKVASAGGRSSAILMLEFSNAVANEVNKKIQNGCSETQLNFAYGNAANVLSYINATAPADKSCDIFGTKGIQHLYLDTIKSQAGISGFPDNRWHFTSSDMSIMGVGPDTYIDLTMQAANITLETCLEINKALGINNPNNYPPRSTATFAGTNFNGTFTLGTGTQVNPVAHPLYGIDTACYVSSAGQPADRFYFYKVLIAK